MSIYKVISVLTFSQMVLPTTRPFLSGHIVRRKKRITVFGLLTSLKCRLNDEIGILSDLLRSEVECLMTDVISGL